MTTFEKVYGMTVDKYIAKLKHEGKWPIYQYDFESINNFEPKELEANILLRYVLLLEM